MVTQNQKCINSYKCGLKEYLGCVPVYEKRCIFCMKKGVFFPNGGQGTLSVEPVFSRKSGMRKDLAS